MNDPIANKIVDRCNFCVIDVSITIDHRYPIQLPGVILLRPYLSGAVAYAKLSSAEQRAALYACAQGNFAACGFAIGKVYKNRDQKL